MKTGTRLGPYEILELLGAGGMGEVYRALDSRLGRTVAVKVLPDHLSSDPERRMRFEREAKAISSLNHPHICALFDVGREGETDFLVLEYLEGESLATALEKGPIPLERLLQISVQIADALAAAHRKGVTHRDLKPGNIMLTKTGAVLLDFGLAKPASLPAGSAVSAMVTQSKPMTTEGMVIGTYQYMAPEQLEGKEADARSDIFALGSVIFEMATGKRPFEGRTPASVIAAILEREPSLISSLQPAVPRSIDRIVKKCLAKDPDERWQSAQDLKDELKWVGEGDSQTSAGILAKAESRPARYLPWVLAAVASVAAIAFAFVNLSRTPAPAPLVRSYLLPPANTSFKPFNFAVSPDGTRLAFVATDSQGKNMLWVRSLSSVTAQKIPGTEDPEYPFWSPDSRRVGFFAEGKLKVVSVTGGAVQALADARAGRGGTWGPDGTIIYAPFLSGGLFRVPDTGGTPQPITKVPATSGQAHRWPYFLPGGKHFLYFVDWSTPQDAQQNGIYIGSLDGSPARLLSGDFGGNVYYAGGRLLFARDYSLMAQPFDAGSIELKGSPAVIAASELPLDKGFSESGYSVSENGILVFQSLADSTSQLEWFDPTGKSLGKIEGGAYSEPRISPDGRYVALSSDDAHDGKTYIRIEDLARGISTQITRGGNESSPSWSPDGKLITYNITPAGSGNSRGISQVAADGSGRSSAVLATGRVAWGNWSPEGNMVFSDFSAGIPRLSVYSAKSKKSISLKEGGAEARFSPDGHWIAYTSSSTGIFAQPYPGPGAHIQISNGGGCQAVWSRDGKNIFYISPGKKLMEVPFDERNGTAGAPREVFQTRIIAPCFIDTQYDVAPDGRFLINSLPADHASPLTLITNWTAALEQK